MKYTITPNRSRKTITIRVYDDAGRLQSKYRSYRLDKDDWNYYGEGYATERDIRQFLKSTDYYKVK